MAVEWTTAQIVRDQLTFFTTSSVSDAIIQEFIEQWEGYAESIYAMDDIAFDSTKKRHKLIRMLVTKNVAKDLLIAAMASAETLDQIGMAADILSDQIAQIEKKLDDRRVMQNVRDA